MTADVKLAQIENSFCLQDVTDDPVGLSAAFDIVVEGYSALSSRKPDPHHIRETVCYDQYHRCGAARTFLLTGEDPETAEVEALGTIRINLPSAGAEKLGLPPLEAMSLMTFPEGWENFRFECFDLNQVVEGARVAVRANCRTGTGKEIGLSRLVLRTLVEGAFSAASQTYGKSQLWGILPLYMVKRFESFGMRVILAPRVSLVFGENARLFQEYDGYWLRSNPSFCKVIVPRAGYDEPC
jgi:hypothetical protein